MKLPNVRGGQLKLLSRDELKEIHYASLEILHQTGLTVLSDRALKILDEAGAAVDPKKNQAKIPPYLVEEAIRKTPSMFTLHGRGKIKYRFEQGRTYYGMGGAPPFVIDLDGHRRKGTYEDIKRFLRLGDALDYIHIPSSCLQGTVEEMNQPEIVTMAQRFLLYLQNTIKPGPSIDNIHTGTNESIQLQLAATGENIQTLRRQPLTWLWHCPTSPLTYSKELTDSTIVYAEQGLPILFAPEVMGGASGPATLAGILAQQTAEFFGGAVIAQLAASKEHRPHLIMGTVSGVVDLRNGVYGVGTAESGLLNVGTAQLAQFYNIPSRGTGGAMNANVPDAQSGIESGITLLMAALAGHTFIYDATGAIEPAVLAMSYEKVIIDHDMVGLVTRVLEGIEVSDETLATDVIDDVVHQKGGNFLFSEHTRAHSQSHFYPTIFNRELWEKWAKAGAQSVRQVARNRAQKILAEHQPEPLDTDVEKQVQDVISEIENHYL